MKKPWSVPYLLPVFTLALLLFFGFSSQAMAAATLTVATGGSAIPSNTVGGAWTTLTGPLVAEGNTGDIGTGTIVLTVPIGFEFDATAAPTVLITRTSGSGNNNRNINDLASGTAVVTTVTSTTITFAVTASSSNSVMNSLTWQNIRVRPTAQTPLASGNIVRSGTSIISGVTATNWGALQEVNPLPTTTSISPSSKNVGDGAFPMMVNGTNFVSTSQVQLGGANRTTTYVSATQLSVAILVGDMATAATYNVTVVNPTPGGGTSNAQAFTVTTAFPTATTMAASGVTTVNNGASWAATLNGEVSSNGADTTVSFDYGLTAAYGSSIAATPPTVPGTTISATPVSADLIGLKCNTTFHYRVKATNAAGPSDGSDGTFTTGACAGPFAATDCAAARFGSNLVCTANDVNITNISLAPTVSQTSCVSGTPVTLDLDLTVNFATPDRWDVGIFIANDGKDPQKLPANDGASSCSVDILPIPSAPEANSDIFMNLDGAATIPPDTCGDGNSSLVPDPPTPTGSGIKRMTGVTLPCYASPDSVGNSVGKLFVPFVVSWDNQKSPIGGLCTSNQHPVPNTTSKCNAPASTVSIDVVVLPKIIKTHSGATFNPGDPITYIITVFNDSGGTLKDSMILKDTPGSGLAFAPGSIVTCATSNGSTCPPDGTVTVDDLLVGISIPSVNLPNNSSLIFEVTGTLSGSIDQTISNTATVSIGPNTNSSTDSVTLGSASGSKSFAPAAITEGNNSLMTITFTNPTASAVTGVWFLDTYPAGLVNAAIPGGSTTCGGMPTATVTATAGGNTLTFSGGTIPASGSCTVSVYVTSDTANNYINSVSFTPGSLGSASATLTVNVAVFGAFNACDVGTSCTNITTPTTSRIITKIAGSPFSLDLVALKTDGSRNTNYSNDVLVELLDASDNSGALDAYNCRSSWTAVIATLSPNPAFANPDNGLKTAGPFITTVPEAYRDVRVRVTNAGGATKKGCSTDNFAIRPAIFTLIAQDTNAETAGTTRTLNNVVVTGEPVHKAGRPFTFTATAYNAAATPAPTTNYVNTPGYPTMTPSLCTGSACTESFGTFSPGVTSFTSGTLFSEVASYSEVGSFNLTLQDTDFASVDAADTAASCAGYYVCSAATPVGRFVPDHFYTAVMLSAGVPMSCPTGLTCPISFDQLGPWSYANAAARTAATGFVASDVGKIARQLDDNTFWELTATTPTWSLAIFRRGFVYSGQPFSVQVTAKNAGGNTTQNYQGVFAKAVTLSAAATNGDAAVIATGGAGEPTLASAAVTGFSSGVGVASPIFTFATALTAPTNIFMRADEPLGWDGVTSLRASSVEGGVKVVSGRVKIANAYGSELLPLSLPATVQYYNAAGSWVTSNSDTVTAINPSDFALAFPVATLVACDTSVSITGSSPSFRVNLSAPGTGNNGWTGLTLNLGATVVGNQCTAVGGAWPLATTANRPWLQYPWGGAAAINPTARATFGVYKGNNQFIYLREMY